MDAELLTGMEPKALRVRYKVEPWGKSQPTNETTRAYNEWGYADELVIASVIEDSVILFSTESNGTNGAVPSRELLLRMRRWIDLALGEKNRADSGISPEPSAQRDEMDGPAGTTSPLGRRPG